MAMTQRYSSLGEINSPEYGAWTSAKSRCSNPKDPEYKGYGGRGITVCERWRLSYQAFLDDMGRKPTPKHTLDRFPNNDGNYEPGNCRWATYTQQNRNSRNSVVVEFKGVKLNLSAWAEKLGFPQSVIHQRMSRHRSIERVLTTPMRKYPRNKAMGKETQSSARTTEEL